MTRLRVLVHVSPYGNLYMREVADLLCRGFDDLGVANAIVQHELPRDQPGVCNLVVAPHEFFTLHPNVSEVQTLEAAACSVLLNTEQPETLWFGIVLRYLRVARAVFDMNSFAVHQLVERDVQAHLLLLGYHPSWDRWGGDESMQRPLDAVYMGSLTERRSEALARVAPVLAGRRTRFLIHDGRVPVTHDGDGYVTGDEKHDLLAHTRLLLNVHRSKVPYFEWHRNMPAISNGCLVVTEPGESHDPLMPWEHFAVAPSDSFSEFVEMLLASPDVVHRLVHQGYDFVRHGLRLTDQLGALLPVCEDAAVTGPPTAPGDALHREHREPARRGPRPAPRTEPPRRREHARRARAEAVVDAPEEARPQDRRARVPHGHRRRPARGDHRQRRVERSRPEISIVIPVYNYERYVTQALGSAAGSRGLDVELVVIDDHSTDGSRAIVEKFQNDRPEVALRIVSLSVNTGLSAVRNRALDHVRADYVFFLDADNSVYPDALRTLHERVARCRRPDRVLVRHDPLLRRAGPPAQRLPVERRTARARQLHRRDGDDATTCARRARRLLTRDAERARRVGGLRDVAATREQRAARRSSCPRSSAAIECTAHRWSPPSTSTRSSHASTCATSTRAFPGRNWSWYPLTPDTVSPTTSAESAAAGVTAGGGAEQVSLEHVRRLEADLVALRTELQRKDAALASLCERLVDVEAAARGRCEARARRPHRCRTRAGPPRGDEALPLRAASPATRSIAAANGCRKLPPFARDVWTRVEAIHAVTYFASESREAAKAAGLKGFWMGYFGFRAAPLGAVGPGVVEAAFYNFAPAMVRRSIPDAWSFARPEALVVARGHAAASTLRAVAPNVSDLAASVVGRLAHASGRGRMEGRPLYAANRSVAAGDDPVEALWQACTLIREHRGDGHVMALVDAGLDGLEAHVLFAADRDVDAEVLRDNRGWTHGEWTDAVAAHGRGLLANDGTITASGHALRDQVEAVTDTLAGELFDDLADDDPTELLRDLDVLVDQIDQAGVIPFPNPMGLPRRAAL